MQRRENSRVIAIRNSKGEWIYDLEPIESEDPGPMGNLSPSRWFLTWYHLKCQLVIVFMPSSSKSSGTQLGKLPVYKSK
ncbi:hypothetical protein EPI10_034455 [Gossypium australe]|uniref:Uncharacterized protein n=1 Tax=Gossypium australe TaxID=47621 RepID=A0A5B6U5G7_9ROSI|nr:hypothetical protein EPI10_034455 [Gossypium australe]